MVVEMGAVSMFIEGRVAGHGGPRKQYNVVGRKHPPCLYNQP